MDEYVFSAFSVNRYGKTYESKKKQLNNSATAETRKVLTTKNAIKLLLEGTLKSEVCRYCMNVTYPLSELDQIMQVANSGSLFKVTIRDMLASFYHVKVVEDPNFPNKICEKCLDNTISAYLFTQQCEQAERALRNCFNNMYDKFEKLDPVDRPKKRGRQKRNPNYNVLYTEHENVIDYAQPIINLINSGSETMIPENEISQFECLKCCQILPNIESLLNHEKLHPKSMWFNCRMCGKSFAKRYQIKRHLQSHLFQKERKNIENNFVCIKCGNVQDHYKEFLQHIEKHKFKMVMEHLVERKMDKLCSICLNKRAGMVELEKVISLHGGCPELTGDQTLHSILASTLPNPKSYKYQELHIPREAYILKVVKKPGGHYIPLGFTLDSLKPVMFSKPIIITNDDYDVDDDYIFMFCGPTFIKPSSTEIIEQDNNINAMDFDSKKFQLSEISLNIDESTSTLGAIKNIYEEDFNMNSNCNNDLYNYPELPEELEETKPDEDTKVSNISISIVEENFGNAKLDVQFKQNQFTTDQDLGICICDTTGNLIKKEGCNKPTISNIKANIVEAEQNITNILEETLFVSNKYYNNVFTFSKPINTIIVKKEYIIEENETKAIEDDSKDNNYTEIIAKLCKTCWIFDKPTCKTCIMKNKSKDVNTNVSQTLDDIGSEFKTKNKIKNEERNSRNSCKYCWLFKHVNQCYYCKRTKIKNTTDDKVNVAASNYLVDQLKIDHRVKGDDDTKISHIIEEKNLNNKEKDNMDDIMTNNKTTKTQFSSELNNPMDVNESNVETNYLKPKSLKRTKDDAKDTWDCPICLTSNKKNIENCHCCDSKRFKCDVIKVNFGAHSLKFNMNDLHTVKKRIIPENSNVINNETEEFDIPSYNINKTIEKEDIPKEFSKIKLMDTEIANDTDQNFFANNYESFKALVTYSHVNDSNQITSRNKHEQINNTILPTYDNNFSAEDTKTPNINVFDNVFKGSPVLNKCSIDGLSNISYKNDQYEEMEVIEEPNFANVPANHVIKNIESSITGTQFQFNIGKTDIAGRKFRRAVRKMSRASY